MSNIEAELRALREELNATKELVTVHHKYPQLMTSRQCAEYLSCSESALRLWRKCRERGERKGPPFLHIGHKSIYYDRDDVLEWARAARVA